MTKSSRPPTDCLDYISRTLLPSLMKHKYAWPFVKAVDYMALNLPDYPKIIRHPMDFSKVRDKLKLRQYFSANECVKDISIIFSNCYLFNQPGEDVVYMAMKLDLILKEKIKFMSSEYSIPFSDILAPPPLHNRGNMINCDKTNTLHGKRKLEDLVTKNTNKIHRTESKNTTKEKNAIDTSHIEKCSYIIKEIMSSKYQKFNTMFLHPVDVKKLNLFDYYDIVKKPMDLNTIKSKLDANLYVSKDRFVDDVELIFNNCLKYNGEASELGIVARRFHEIFKTICTKIFNSNKPDDRPSVVKSNTDINSSISKAIPSSEKVISKPSKQTTDFSHKSEASEKGYIVELLNTIEKRQEDVLHKFKKVQELVSVQHTAIDELYQKCFGKSAPNPKEFGDVGSLMKEIQQVRPQKSQLNGVANTPKSVKKTTPKNMKSATTKSVTHSAKKVSAPVKKNNPVTVKPEKIINKVKSKVEAYQPMTYEEKKRLSININQLRGAQLEMVVEIVKANEISLQNEEGNDVDIDIDFETLQPKTLRELEAFVSGVGHNVSTKKNGHNGTSHSAQRNRHSSDEFTVQHVPATSMSGKQMREPVPKSHHSQGSSSSSSSSSDESDSSSSESNRSIS